MIKFLTSFVSVLLGISLLCVSCNKADEVIIRDGGAHFSVSYGEVIEVPEGFNILTDLGRTLQVKEMAPTVPELIDGQRVFINFSILDQSIEMTDIRLNVMEVIPTQKLLFLSELTEQEHEQLGDDPVKMLDPWFGGKYINIEYTVRVGTRANGHRFNLVVDEENSDEDHVVLRFIHNANGDGKTGLETKLISFDLSDIVPEGKREIPVVLEWKEESDQLLTDTGIFQPPTNTLRVAVR